MANLYKKISEEESEFHLGSMNLFCPPLKQIGNSISEIRTHYMSNDTLNIIPSTFTPKLAVIRDSLFTHLNCDSFLYKTNIVTGSSMDSTGADGPILPSFVVLMDSLALAMGFEIYPRPSHVQCDILLAICGQPVIVLTPVDGEKDSETVTMYNASVARGVSSTLRKFMDESVNVVFGVLCRRDIENLDTFRSSIETIAKQSSMFVPLSTLSTNASKYEKILTAFWAGVAETKAVVSRDGRVDTAYLRFLTKDQCIVLMENINNKEVEVQFQPGTGATTLMVEVARRLARLDNTLLVCRSEEDKERLRTSFPSFTTVAPNELNSLNISLFQHVVDETCKTAERTSGCLWRFSRSKEDDGEEIVTVQPSVTKLEDKLDKTGPKSEPNMGPGKVTRDIKTIAHLTTQLKINGDEKTFDLGSMNLFRPALKPIGNSIYEIKTHYKSQDFLNIIPSQITPHLAVIRDSLLTHLEEDSFLFKTNIVSGSSLISAVVDGPILPSFVFLMDSLALAMDFEISPRPSDVQCDILLAICGQPVIVLTLVDGDKDSETVTMYNASVARGVSSTLRNFIDESVNVVFGVLCRRDIEKLDTFRSSIETIAKQSSMFVALSTLSTNASKYEKIVIAFWAGVTETKAVVSRDGRVDTDYLRFLTKDQCIVLMENINIGEVEVQFQPGTGATTLMVEVARRLARLDNTLLVCRTHEENERLRTSFPSFRTVVPDELTSLDVSLFRHVVDETGKTENRTSGRLWRFSRAEEDHTEVTVPEQHAVMEREEKSDETELRSQQYKDTGKDTDGVNMKQNSMAHLLTQLKNSGEEETFDLGSMNLFRPPLKQFGNSIHEIKTHYMSQGTLNIIPSTFEPHLAVIRESLLTHLEEDSFLFKTNIVTGSSVDSTRADGPSFVVLMDSLALAMDFEISPRPSDVQCDVLLAICGQPVIVLTLVDGDKDSETVTMYNASVATGVSSTLRKFMDESVNVVFGVLCQSDFDTLDIFRTSIHAIAKDSSLFVTLSTLETNPSKYEKIVTAFWAGVAETRFVISEDGRVDTDYLRFLTKEQCIILMENINNREVDIRYDTCTGATTLMIDAARRLDRLDKTLLVCRSLKEKERLRPLFQNTKTASDLRSSDWLKFTNVVNDTAMPLSIKSGRVWKFTRDSTLADELQQDVDAFEQMRDKTQKRIYLFCSGDRREKMKYLLRELETLKFLDITIQWLLLFNSLSSSLSFKYRPVHHFSPGDGDINQRLETEDFIQHVLGQIKLGIEKRRDLFPLLVDVIKQVKLPVPCVLAESDHQQKAASDKLVTREEKMEADTTMDQDLQPLGVWLPVEQRGRVQDTTGRKSQNIQLEFHPGKVTDPEKITRKPKSQVSEKRKDEIIKLIDAKENWNDVMDYLSHGNTGTWIHDILATDIPKDPDTPCDELDMDFKEPCRETTSETLLSIKQEKSTQEEKNGQVEDSRTKELQERLKIQEREAVRQREELRELAYAADHLVEWEYAMDCLSQQMATIWIQDFITDIIGEDELPLAPTEQPMKPRASSDDARRTRRSQVHQLRTLQHGTLRKRHLLDIVNDVMTGEQRRLSYLQIQIDRLDRGPPMTLDRERVNRDLAVSGDGLELVNTRGSLDQGTDRLRYYGTCSRQPIPLPLSPSTLTVPRYWETHSRVQVKGPVSRSLILDMSVSREGKVDWWIPFWSVFVEDCRRHPGHICTKVWEEDDQVGKCLTDTMSPTPGTDVTLIYGVVLDMGRGRLAFIDVNRGRVLHKFDLDISESLFPLFGTRPFDDSQCDVAMRLVSGREIAMTDEKKRLIATALYSQ